MGSLEGKKVAIAGFGIEGKSAARYFMDRGASITIFDENEFVDDIPEGAETVLGEKAFRKIEGFDLVSRTPSIRPDSLPSDSEMTSVTKEFFKRSSAPIIGVTGTKGKGTTTTLIAEILKAAGKTVHVVGNIGQPALDVLGSINPDDVVCYELSSFQLWDLNESPHVAVVLMIDTDHMDVHESMEEYVNAKAEIADLQTPEDVIVVHPKNQYSQSIAAQSSAKKVEYMTDSGAFIRGDEVVINEHVICTRSEIGLIGDHNLENVTAAISAAWEYTQDVDAIAHAVKNFTGLPHRLQFVADKQGVRFYDDSYSTASLAASAAMKAFGDKTVAILGGKDKGNGVDPVISGAIEANIKHAMLIGETAQQLKEGFDAVGFSKYTVVEGGMDDIVKAAVEVADEGDCVMLSPGTSSFDMFKNYSERGDLFQQAVHTL